MNTKTKSMLLSAALLTLPLLPATVRNEIAWTVAGILGLAVLEVSFTLRAPKMAAVRVRSRNGQK